MKKIKFLSCAFLAAIMALGFTSCEKENFNTQTDVDIDVPVINIPGVVLPPSYQPGDAVLSIQPTVIANINGLSTTVTNEAKITYNGESELKYEVNCGFRNLGVSVFNSISSTIIFSSVIVS